MTAIEMPCGKYTIIDNEDAPRLDGYRLHAEARGNTFYVRMRTAGQRGGGKYLHNFLMSGRADHIDGDGLNNRKSNLRPCTQAQNGLNRSAKAGKRFKGVYTARSGKYYAQIYINRKSYSVHGLATEEIAAREYDRLARLHHGEWARLNFPEHADQSPPFDGWTRPTGGRRR
jgi:hypothetical protein